MEQVVLLRIRSEQQYEGEEPEIMELTSKGLMQERDGVILLSYEESELTGLQGTRTCFAVTPDRIVLTREGMLQSEMIFSLAEENRSLYDMGFGALMITVRTVRLIHDLHADGGSIEVHYDLLVEDSYVGQVSYLIEVRPISSAKENS